MGRAVVLACLSVLLWALALVPATDALGFTCNSPPETTCQALVGYISPNTTTFRSIQTLFGVKHLRSLLAVNNRSPTLSPNTTVRAQETVIIPFTCRCSNGTGISDGSPVYTVQKDDGLYYIASSVFSYLVVYQDIQLVNGIENANLIEVGQKLWIPLPCSCDEVDGNKAVHYAHVVAEGSTVEQIAEDFGVSDKTLMDLNGLASAKELMADKALDLPLKACASKIHNDSLDADLLVPNGAYALTANNCVRCSCDSANNWTLLCQPSEFASSSGSTCPSMQCSGAHDLYIGNTTGTSCSSTTCSYAGYTSQNTILTILNNESSCPACASKIHNDSLDADLLVPNGAYATTANNCVRCSCDSANNWTSVTSSSNPFRNLNTYSQKSSLPSSTFSSDQAPPAVVATSNPFSDQAPPAVVASSNPFDSSTTAHEGTEISASQVLAVFGGVGGFGAAFWFGWYLRGKFPHLDSNSRTQGSISLTQGSISINIPETASETQRTKASNDKGNKKGRDKKGNDKGSTGSTV